MIFHEKPDGFNVRRHVVICLVEAEKKVLLLQRRPDVAERQAGKWGLPGGTVEEYESEDAMWRELGEEADIWTNKKELVRLHTLYVRYDTYDFVFTIFHLILAKQPPININREEHIAYCWVSPKDALRMQLVRDQDAFFKLCCPELA